MNTTNKLYSVLVKLLPREKEYYFVDKLLKGGCSDAAIRYDNGIVYLDFLRKGTCLAEIVAVISMAIHKADIGGFSVEQTMEANIQ